MRELSFDEVGSVSGGAFTVIVKAGKAIITTSAVFDAVKSVFETYQAAASYISSHFSSSSSSSSSMLTTSSSGVFSFGGSPTYPGSYGSGASSGSDD